jgi:hypothetical protein
MTALENSYNLKSAVLDTETEINARIASQMVDAKPTLRRF